MRYLFNINYQESIWTMFWQNFANTKALASQWWPRLEYRWQGFLWPGSLNNTSWISWNTEWPIIKFYKTRILLLFRFYSRWGLLPSFQTKHSGIWGRQITCPLTSRKLGLPLLWSAPGSHPRRCVFKWKNAQYNQHPKFVIIHGIYKQSHFS